MNTTFSILVATILLVAATSAEAARSTPGGNSNLILSASPVISTAPPQTNPIGGANQGIAPGLPEINPVTGQTFGALPGQPGSPNYDPNAALPNVNVPGSALGPAGSSNLTPTGTSGGANSP
jgi:hypothetical protein